MSNMSFEKKCKGQQINDQQKDIPKVDKKDTPPKKDKSKNESPKKEITNKKVSVLDQKED